MKYSKDIKHKVLLLRKAGHTYGEIQKILKTAIPKSTLSTWVSGIIFSPEQIEAINNKITDNCQKGREAALLVIKNKKNNYLQSIADRVQYLGPILKNKDVAKIALVMLYLGEGSKIERASLMFGNSNQTIIKLFLYLLRYCYNIDENKFRCTVQCRFDQDIPYLEQYWSNVTKIPLSKFYKARIDPRTKGKPTKKANYKGVCRIDYFSSEIFNEYKKIVDVLYKTIEGL